MSRFVNVPTGNYKIKTQEGGSIILDTGLDVGEVFVTGNLTVQGDTTTINTTNLEIEDNILVLNKNQVGAGISLGTSGIEINRGSFPQGYFLYNESFRLATDSVDIAGGFELKNGSELTGLKAIGINTDNDNFYFELGSNGILKLKVNGTTYTEKLRAESDPDSIPNKAYVDQEILNIGDNVSVSGLADNDTEILLRDSQNRPTVLNSFIGFNVDGVEVSKLDSTSLKLHNIEIDGNLIKSTALLNNPAIDLVLKHADNPASVVIDKVLRINPVGLTFPTTPAVGQGVKIYNDEESIGGTGIYFVNQEGTRDEMVSKSRAILYGIIF